MAKKRAVNKAPGTQEETPRVVEIPPRCPRVNCRSTKRTKREGLRTRILRETGHDREGNPYNERRISYVQCVACGQRYSVISFHYVVRDANRTPVTSGK